MQIKFFSICITLFILILSNIVNCVVLEIDNRTNINLIALLFAFRNSDKFEPIEVTNEPLDKNKIIKFDFDKNELMDSVNMHDLSDKLMIHIKTQQGYVLDWIGTNSFKVTDKKIQVNVRRAGPDLYYSLSFLRSFFQPSLSLVLTRALFINFVKSSQKRIFVSF